MFNVLNNLTKATINIALAPVAIVVDTVMLPIDAESNSDVYSRTAALLKNAGECVDKAVDPNED